MDKAARFDVLSLEYCDNQPKIELIKNAFDLAPDYTY